MRNIAVRVAIIVVLAVQATLAGAVVVPDDYRTIQAALDAGAELIQVKDDLPPEHLVIGPEIARYNHVTIEAGSRGSNHPWSALPRIQSIEIAEPCDRKNLKFRGIHFVGAVNFTMCAGSVVFEACRFDFGLAAPNFKSIVQSASVRGCTILGDATVFSAYTQFISNTVIGGKVTLWTDGLHDVRDNYVVGPASVGLDLRLYDSEGPVSGNIVRNTGIGIRVDHARQVLSKNDISGCSEDGILHTGLAPFLALTCDSNLVTNCGGAGIAVRGTPNEWGSREVQLSGNRISNVAGHGVDLVGCFAWPVQGNTILGAGGDGFRAKTAELFTGNSIGKNGGVGVRLANVPATTMSNTIFMNREGGMKSDEGSPASDVRNNIFAFNGGLGMEVGDGAPSLTCNDWFGNVDGAVVGAPLDSTNLFVDPLFCDYIGGFVDLRGNSPLLSAGACGLIGARGYGCPALTAVLEPAAWTTKGMHAYPVPSRGAVSFSLPPSTTSLDLEVFDILGARRWQTTLAAGTSTHTWNIRQTTGGRPIAPGVYFARLRRGNEELARTRVVVSE